MRASSLRPSPRFLHREGGKGAAGTRGDPIPQRTRTMNPSPRLLITMGDVAGIGPEIIARAWPGLQEVCRPVVVGDPFWMGRALEQVGARASLQVISRPEDAAPSPDVVPCLAASDQDLRRVETGRA